MAKKATTPAADLTDSEAPETVMAPFPVVPGSACDHCHVELRESPFTGMLFCPSCFRVQQAAQVAP